MSISGPAHAKLTERSALLQPAAQRTSVVLKAAVTSRSGKHRQSVLSLMRLTRAAARNTHLISASLRLAWPAVSPSRRPSSFSDLSSSMASSGTRCPLARWLVRGLGSPAAPTAFQLRRLAPRPTSVPTLITRTDRNFRAGARREPRGCPGRLGPARGMPGLRDAPSAVRK